MKKCPYCSEEIQDTAKKCKHCGDWLNKDKKESIKEKIIEKSINTDTKIDDRIEKNTKKGNWIY